MKQDGYELAVEAEYYTRGARLLAALRGVLPDLQEAAWNLNGSRVEAGTWLCGVLWCYARVAGERGGVKWWLKWWREVVAWWCGTLV